MELEELQSVWSEMSLQLEKQKKLTHKIIMEMTQRKYSDKFQKFMQYEGMGTVICFGMALVLLFNFGKLDTWYFMLLGILALAFLLGLPVMVLRSLYRIQSVNIIEGSYKDTLLTYARARKKLLYVQRLSIYLGFVFVFISLPLAGKLIRNEDFFSGSLMWLWYVPLLSAFIYFFSRWTYKSYLQATEKAEALIRELE